MNQSAAKINNYHITAAVRKALKDLRYAGHTELSCSALLSQKSKRVNSIQALNPGKFPKVLLSYIDAEKPDKVQIEIHSSDDNLVWTKIFRIESLEDAQPVKEFQGFGKAEFDAMVDQKLAQIQQQQELERLRVLSEELENENRELQRQVEEIEQTLQAKNTIEHLMSLAGTYGPKILSLLRGNLTSGHLGDGSVPGAKLSLSDDQRAIVEMTAEFLQGKTPSQTEHFYYLLIELSNQPDRMKDLVQQVNTKNHPHEI